LAATGAAGDLSSSSSSASLSELELSELEEEDEEEEEEEEEEDDLASPISTSDSLSLLSGLVEAAFFTAEAWKRSSREETFLLSVLLPDLANSLVKVAAV
jgi:hypothetical protein